MLKINYIAPAMLITGTFLVLSFFGVASAQDGVATEQQQSLCKGANTLSVSGGVAGDGDPCANAGNAGGKINNLITAIVNIFSVIVGIVAVIMIIIGGFKYITSSGDSGRIASAKSTIIYAIVGLVIVALAQFVVRFVLAKATNVAS